MTDPSTRRSELSALRELINTSLDIYQAELDKEGFPEPGLKDPTPHPTDDPTFLPSRELFESRQRLVGALGMMLSIIQFPGERAMMLSLGHHASSSLSVVVKADVARILVEAGPKGMPVDELGKRVGVHPLKLTKVLRYLANLHIFHEPTEGYFANTRTSLPLINTVRDYVSFASWSSLLASPLVSPTLFDPITSHSFKIEHAPLAIAGKFAERGASNYFDWVKSYPGRWDEFSRAMSGLGTVGISGLVADFPWGELPPDTVLIDVGGGEGGLTLPLLKKFPTLKAIVQDTPDTVEQASRNFQVHLPDAITEGRIHFEAHDFFKPQPRKGDEYVYAMRWITHDWPDEECTQILSRLAEAMSIHSRLLIIDTVLYPASEGQGPAVYDPEQDNNSLHRVPYPLPLSYGFAGRFKQGVAYEMMTAFNATERTATEFSQLFQNAGLKLVKIWPTRAQHFIVEAALA